MVQTTVCEALGRLCNNFSLISRLRDRNAAEVMAVLSAVRFMANAVMLLQLERRGAEQSTHPASLLGTVFEL